MPLGKLAFCERFIHLERQPISFAGRPYLPSIYSSNARNLVLRCSRQTEKSTFLVNTMLYEACTRPGQKILFVAPRFDQARLFSHARVLPCLEQSPLVRRELLGRTKRRPPITNLQFQNGSSLFIRAAFRSADAVRGISADLLLVDEYQDVAPGDLPVLQETLSHSPWGRTILTGTPKTIDNHLEAVFNQSTANEWTVTCPDCQKRVILDEHALGEAGPICQDCNILVDPRAGTWQPRNPGARWGDGFSVNHLMVPWLDYDDILDRQRTYDFARFKNEVLGLPTTLGEHVVTRAELEACCGPRAMARSYSDVPHRQRERLIAGIDWGGGESARTVVAVGYLDDAYVFHVCRFEHYVGTEDPKRVLEDVAKLCRELRVPRIAADGGGNGHVYNRLLLDRLARGPKLTAIRYSETGQAPQPDGVLIKWTINRSASIGGLFGRVKKRSIVFPRVEECGSYLDEFAAEYAEYNDETRTVRYTHPETQQDDALHATVYAFQLAVNTFTRRLPDSEDWR